MLEDYKKQHTNTNVQFILTDEGGIVLESNNTLIEVNVGSSIVELHPFFESLPSLVESSEQTLNFHCVNVSLNDVSLIIDIQILKKEKEILIILHDFTTHYNSYQSVAQSRNESIIKTELTVLKNLELEERERFKNQFIQNFSHELRNPMTSIMAICNILEDTGLTTEQGSMLDFLKQSTSNLSLLLEDTLNIGMIDAGKVEIQNKLFGVRKLFELLKFTYTTKAGEKGLELESSWDERIPEFVEGDRLRLFQVLTNLLDNAIKYTTEGTISLKVSLNQKRANKVNIRFLVADTGTGIEQGSLDSIFDSFSRLNTVKNTHGVGLGLTIVKRFLELMGSKINVESKKDEGSTFYFDLSFKHMPLAKKNKVKTKSAGSASKTIKPQKKYRLLMVEDDENVQTTLFKMLLNTNKFHIDLVYDGALVLQEVVNNTYDVILMDVNIPSIKGDEVTRLIRTFPFKNVKNIPIIGMTANAFEEDIKAFLNSGMNDVLIKPFEKEALVQKILKVLT